MMMMSNKMFYNDVGDDETSQSVRTGLIVVQSSHAPGLKAIFEKYDRGVDDDDDKFCDDDDSFLLDCKFCCMTTKYVGIAYKFCISIDHLMFYVQNKLVRKKVFFILSCFYRTIVLKPKKNFSLIHFKLFCGFWQNCLATFGTFPDVESFKRCQQAEKGGERRRKCTDFMFIGGHYQFPQLFKPYLFPDLNLDVPTF